MSVIHCCSDVAMHFAWVWRSDQQFADQCLAAGVSVDSMCYHLGCLGSQGSWECLACCDVRRVGE